MFRTRAKRDWKVEAGDSMPETAGAIHENLVAAKSVVV